MANPNVIDYSYFSKPYPLPTNNQSPTTNNYVSEPDPDYGDDLLTKLATLLKIPAWPQFPDGAYLNTDQATRLYRAAHGTQALLHILNRSAHLQCLTQDYDEPNQQLTEYQQSQLWAAAIELGGELVGVVDEVHERAQENS